jgi:hypothetical protein
MTNPVSSAGKPLTPTLCPRAGRGRDPRSGRGRGGEDGSGTAGSDPVEVPRLGRDLPMLDLFDRFN